MVISGLSMWLVIIGLYIYNPGTGIALADPVSVGPNFQNLVFVSKLKSTINIHFVVVYICYLGTDCCITKPMTIMSK